MSILNPFGLIGNLVESIYDNIVKDKVYPVEGSILYCDLLFGSAEHSGVYIGNNEIVHLDGTGIIEIVTPDEFLGRVNGFNSAISIYVSCDGEIPVGGKSIAKRAKSKVGSKRYYNLVADNCHQFTSGCITNDFENSDNFLWMLKDTSKKSINATTWRVWETTDGEYI